MNTIALFKSKLIHQNTFTQMLPLEEARAFYAQLRKLGLKPSTTKKGGHRLTNKEGYLTFSPKGSKVHVLAKRTS